MHLIWPFLKVWHIKLEKFDSVLFPFLLYALRHELQSFTNFIYPFHIYHSYAISTQHFTFHSKSLNQSCIDMILYSNKNKKKTKDNCDDIWSERGKAGKDTQSYAANNSAQWQLETTSMNENSFRMCRTLHSHTHTHTMKKKKKKLNKKGLDTAKYFFYLRIIHSYGFQKYANK